MIGACTQRRSEWVAVCHWQNIPSCLDLGSCLKYSAIMNKNGTISDITRWAEETLPGEDARARSVITICRRAGLFTKGGRGRHAPMMMLTDFPTAILAVLHPGLVTQVDEAVQEYWGLPFSLLTIEDPDRNGPFDALPQDIGLNPDLLPYIDRYKLSLFGGANLLGVLTVLFSDYAPHHDFHSGDFIELQTAGDKVAIRLSLGSDRYGADGWPQKGPEHAILNVIFGDVRVFDTRAVKTTRTIYGDALNVLSRMTPNFGRSSKD